MSVIIQELVHRFEEGGGIKIVRVVVGLILTAAVAGLYDVYAFHNYNDREAMDMAQVGRNLAEGGGFSTLLVRPLSIFLVQQHRADHSSELKTAHPDLANPPVYPCLLAAVFRCLPKPWFHSPMEGFKIYYPELVVALCNQTLLLLAGVILFLLTNRLFEGTMAWVTSIVFVGSESLWRFSVSGLNTLLLVLLVLAVVWCLLWLEEGAREGWNETKLVLLAGLTGIVVGVGGLTRYSFAWLIVPVVFYLLAFLGRQRAVLVLAALGACLVVMAPWVWRNVSVCGLPFGTATLSVFENTHLFPEDRLHRSLEPNLHAISVTDFAHKALVNSRELVQNDLPKLGGSWVTAFFLVGLLLPFRQAALARLRWFLIFSLIVFGLVQVLGRTNLAQNIPTINSENMLVLLSPLVFMYGVALFFVLLDSIALPFPSARTLLISVFCLVGSFPLIQALLPPHASPIAYPPYFPPRIQKVCGWFNEKELIMSDMPWAVAWYGRRQSVWTTLDWKRDFVKITDYHKSIKGLYLTYLTTDSRFLSNWIKGENAGWASFLLETMMHQEVPTGFPLRRAPQNFFPEQVLLTDYDRWKLRKD